MRLATILSGFQCFLRMESPGGSVWTQSCNQRWPVIETG